jgi:hypothetical protein
MRKTKPFVIVLLDLAVGDKPKAIPGEPARRS